MTHIQSQGKSSEEIHSLTTDTSRSSGITSMDELRENATIAASGTVKRRAQYSLRMSPMEHPMKSAADPTITSG